MIGKNRPRITAILPCFTKNSLASCKCFSLIKRPKIGWWTNFKPTVRPNQKLSESPVVAAIQNSNINTQWLSELPDRAAMDPAANSNESPGRNGKTTAPVSIKITANRAAYDQPPHVFTRLFK